nr:hypothetical protein L203_01550 [Cryptococcus depauperatus CBS 7841]
MKVDGLEQDVLDDFDLVERAKWRVVEMRTGSSLRYICQYTTLFCLAVSEPQPNPVETFFCLTTWAACTFFPYEGTQKAWSAASLLWFPLSCVVEYILPFTEILMDVNWNWVIGILAMPLPHANITYKACRALVKISRSYCRGLAAEQTDICGILVALFLGKHAEHGQDKPGHDGEATIQRSDVAEGDNGWVLGDGGQKEGMLTLYKPPYTHLLCK